MKTFTTKQRRGRGGAAVVAALVLLVVLVGMAAALASVAGGNVRMSKNSDDIRRALLAAESGLSFGSRTVRRVQLHPSTPPDQLMARLAEGLASDSSLTGNLGGQAIVANGSTVVIPRIVTDDGAFELSITLGPGGMPRLCSRGLAGGASRTVAVDLVVLTDLPISAFDFGIAARGPISLGGSAQIRGQNLLTEASLISTTEQAVAVSVAGSSVIDGDISSVGANTSVVITGHPTVAGSQDPSEIADHIHFGVDTPVFPIVDTSIFKPLATTVVDRNTDTSVKGLVLNNVIIKAGTNPTFASDVQLNGVVYIESPNIVSFSSKVTLRGVMATQDNNDPLTSCKINFQGQVQAYAVETLPDLPQYQAVKQLTGTFVVAPGFDVNFAGQFSTINGTIAADKLTFAGQAAGTVQGSVIGLADEAVHIDGTVNIFIDRSGDDPGDAGFIMPMMFDMDMSTYREIVPGEGG